MLYNRIELRVKINFDREQENLLDKMKRLTQTSVPNDEIYYSINKIGRQ